ncbi:MAG: hypothetical protein RLZZ244_2209 [Verrucomicrobiota bacterium]|jgi:hypothetical protein
MVERRTLFPYGNRRAQSQPGGAWRQMEIARQRGRKPARSSMNWMRMGMRYPTSHLKTSSKENGCAPPSPRTLRRHNKPQIRLSQSLRPSRLPSLAVWWSISMQPGSMTPSHRDLLPKRRGSEPKIPREDFSPPQSKGSCSPLFRASSVRIPAAPFLPCLRRLKNTSPCG